jgi:hypothetical protein
MARAAPAATRAAGIVSFLTSHPSRGFTITELVQHLGMNIASAHATLAVLCDFGFLVRHPVHRTYVLGPALAVTGFAALEQHPAVQAAIDQAEILAHELDAEIGVYAIAGRDVIFLVRRGPEPLASTIGNDPIERARVEAGRVRPGFRELAPLDYPGDRSPLLAPFGAVFMAWADDDAVAAWLERAEVTDTVADLYRRVLAEVRNLGFSVPLRPIASPAIDKAMGRLRMDPTDDAEHELTDVLQQTDEMILLFGAFPGERLVAVQSDVPYKTRMVVLRPAKAKKFNGTVVVEFMNSTGGRDNAVMWTVSADYFTREGAVFIGVTTSGNQSMAALLRGCGPAPFFPSCGTRYSSNGLVISNNGQEYEIISQLVTALKSGVPNQIPLPSNFPSVRARVRDGRVAAGRLGSHLCDAVPFPRSRRPPRVVRERRARAAQRPADVQSYQPAVSRMRGRADQSADPDGSSGAGVPDARRERRGGRSAPGRY